VDVPNGNKELSNEKTTVALVTGAAQGIGKRTAIALAERSSNIVLCDLKSTSQVANLLSEKKVNVIELQGDVSNESDVERFVSIVRKEFGRLDVLVNNAGISFIKPATETPAKDFRRVLEVNLVGPFLLCREFGKMMLEQHGGSIINISSIAGLFGISERSVQCKQGGVDRIDQVPRCRVGRIRG